MQQAVCIKGVVDAAALVHAEGEPQRRPARRDGLAVLLALLGRGAVLFLQVLANILPLGRHLRVQLKGLKVQVQRNFALQPIRCLLQRVEADDGYIGDAPYKVKCPASFTNPDETQAMQAIVRMRQETINMRLKQWEILKQVYRHDITKHGYVLRAVAVVVQVAIENGEPLIQVDYNDLSL